LVDLAEIQKKVYANKVVKGFNVKDVYMEFCYMFGEVSEACEAYRQKTGDVGQELADVFIYLLGIAEILGIDLEAEMIKKMEINARRKYIQRDGVNIRVEEG
jgi:NTP pyrophosphatase (non-canonical NTP hydrolase)